MNISILTLGCRTNQAESISFENSLRNNGHQIVEPSENPDIFIINTCTVTSKADYQSRQLINRAIRQGAKIIVTGCFSELNTEYIKKLKGDISIISNKDKPLLINQIPNLTSCDNSNPTLIMSMRTRPIIKVQDGCNYSCSYCAIPQARGKSRSIPPENVIREVQRYNSLGYKEVVLTGIHIGTYGADLNMKHGISDLVEEILLKTEIPRLRLSSIEVNEVNDKLLELMQDLRVCRHLHLPLQSGDDNILKLMNRTYNSRNYFNKTDKLTKEFNDIAIGTDVIAGFPGEGESEFNNTYNAINKLPFAYVHVFPYSKRPNTKALALPGAVDEKTKKQRASELRVLSKLKRKGFISANINRTLDILVEKYDGTNIIGTSRNYIKVIAKSDRSVKEGELINIKITGYLDGNASGELLNSL